MISAWNPSEIPEPRALERLTKALATLDVILSPGMRTYFFDRIWSLDERLASMDNGQGDQWAALFSQDGAIILGFAHEAPVAREGPPAWVYRGLPERYLGVLDEPAFEAREFVTFCVWWDEGAWRSGVGEPVDDGSSDLLRVLDGRPSTYVEHEAEIYHPLTIDEESVRAVYEFKPMTSDMVRRINPGAEYVEVESRLKAIGYPLGR